jgi:hypothetical protein
VGIEVGRETGQSPGVVTSRPYRLFLLAAAAAGGACLSSAADAPKVSGYTVSAEGGVEGSQVIRYDQNGRPIDPSAPLAPKTYVGGTRPDVPTRAAPGPAGETRPPVVNAGPQELVATDGRRLNGFSLSGKSPFGGGNKEVDPNVDVNSALKNAAKGSNLIEKRVDLKNAELGGERPYSRENLITMDTWSGKFDTFGRKKAAVDLVDTFDRGNAQEKNLIEVKSIERPSSPWSRRTADISGWDERRTTEKNSRYDVTPLLASERAAAKAVEQISMQDINRYQFRRNRSTDAGLPVIPVGTDKVKTKGSDGN